METIKVGTTVRLKSGGPVMTIESFATRLAGADIMTSKNVEDKSRVNCQWFEGPKLSKGSFDVMSLDIVASDNDTNKPLGIYIG